MKKLLLFTALLINTIVFAQDADRSFNAGENMYNAGDYAKAIEHYTEAINTKPDFLNAYLRRAFCYSANKQYDEAIADFTKIIELKPDHIWALNSRGSAYNKKEKYDLAMKDFNKVLALDPNNQEAYNNRGWAKKFTGDKTGACNDWKKSKKLGNSEAKIILGNNECK